MEELQGQVWNAVFTLVGTVLTWALVEARKYIKRQVENDYVEVVLLRMTDAVEVGVRDTALNLVPKVREAASDGKISTEEAESLKRAAKQAALDQLTRIDKQKLEELFDREQLERKFDKLIEAAVQRLKEGQKNDV